MSSYHRTYSNMEVRMGQIEPRKNEYQQYFIRADQREIDQIRDIATKDLVPQIQTLLKFIHKKYNDGGLQLTLIHKLFMAKASDIAYYVPQLVYIAIKKPCKSMKKLLIHHAKQSESLRRLILWNVKAFTVLMKKDSIIKGQIQLFEQDLIKHVKNITKFNYSLKAIGMLTQASLILKKMPSPNLKQKLQKFIKRYNFEILNNLDHNIIIPFRQQIQDKNYNSNYIVNIIKDDCSCFPTRKRVPYRIIFQTIDIQQLKQQYPSQKYFNRQKIQPDDQRDLFTQVSQSMIHLKFDVDNIFAKDNDQNKRISQMKNFVFNIQKQQIKQQHQLMSRSKLKTKSTFINNGNQIHNKDSLLKYQIKNSDVKNLDAIYIGSKTPKRRRSHINYNQLNSLENPKPPEIRKSVFLKKQSQTNIQTGNQIQLYNEGDYKGCNFMVEEFYGQSWDVKKNKYLSQSYFKSFKSLRFRNVVVKGGDDLRQQIICMQLIYKIRDIMKDAGVDAFIKPYQIIVLSQNSGLLQFVPNSISVDQMKKKFQGSSISKFFKYLFQQNENKIIQNFIKSLAGSSILTFVLKLKDRHNGNILLDNEGNIIHIDFGFILGMAPGNLNFQSSPFKFTAQYVDIMGGKDSQLYNKFTKIFCQGMMALRKRVDQLTLILQIMMQGSDLDCFKDFDIQDFKNSFRLHYSQQKYFQYCRNLVQKSCMNSRTVHYDTFQYYSNGIMQ